jgi:hypothetical protein
MMEALNTSETSVNIYLTTWQCIPEDSKLQLNISFVMFRGNRRFETTAEHDKYERKSQNR